MLGQFTRQLFSRAVSLLSPGPAGDRGERRTRPVQTFSYRKPADDQKGNKEIVLLCKQDNVRGAVHVVRKGGEEHLHSHATVDGFWMVLSGKAKFYGDNETVLGEFGPAQGVLIPRNTRYWFESSGDQDLELLQVLTVDPGQGFERANHAKPNFNRHGVKWFEGRYTGRG